MGTRVDFTVPGNATVATDLRVSSALFVDNIEIDTTGAVVNQTFTFDGTKFKPAFTYSPSSEPIGFQDRTESVVSFTNATRIFSIAPATTSFTVWCGGNRYIKTVAETVTIPNTSGLHFIYYDSVGVLTTAMTPFDLKTHAPVSVVYWNATDGVQYFFADERHGVTMDWQTHEYLHRTRGAAYASGFAVSGYVLGGNGSLDSHAKIDIQDGVFFDEDLEISISHSATPVANTFQQRLQSGAYIPVYYKTGTGIWKKDTATQFPVKTGATPRACYNLNTAGTWTFPELGQNKYGVTWIAATDNLGEPVLAIMGQAEYNNVGDAEASQWGGLDLSGFPSTEFRPLYRVVFQTSSTYANTPRIAFISLSDLRAAGSFTSGVAITAADHGALTGLADDDHLQYALVDGTRAFTGNVTINGNLTVNGTTLTINSTVATIDDPIITLGGDTAPTVDDNKDRGIEFRWHNGTAAKVGFFGFDDSTGKFTFIPDATNTSEVFSGTTGEIDAKLAWANLLNIPSPVVSFALTGAVTGSASATLTGLGNGSATIATTAAASQTFSTLSLTSASTSLTVAGQISSTVATGTAPLVVASTTAVTNLNANYIEGQNLAALDTRFINTSGDTMTGTLNVTGYGSLVSTLPSQGSYIQPLGTQQIAAAPFSRQWADGLRWRSASLTETSVDGVTFSTTTNTDWTHRPFIGDVTGTYATVPTLDGTTVTSVRWTWASGLQYSENKWFAVSCRYSASAPVITTIWETSPDGITWTPQATAASVTVTNKWTYFRFDEAYASFAQHRITIKRESGVASITSVQWLTNRPGDQGFGANRELPFVWNAGRSVIFQPTLTTNPAISARGAIGNTAGIQTWTDPTGATVYLQVLSDGRLQSTLATGTAPLVIASTTLVTNLNADLLDGQDGTYYTNWTNITNKPSPIISLGGDLSGSVTLTSLATGTYTLNATIAADSIALGTDTTGNYVASVASAEANGIVVTGSGSENAAVTLALPQPLNASATPTFSRAILTQATGTPPLQVTSTTVVSNLNADLLDGQHGTYYNDWTNVTNKPSPTITLTGDVTGTATFTSLSNASVAATVSSTASAISASNILSKLLTVDGTGSLLDADLLDGKQGNEFAYRPELEAVLGDLLYVGLYDPTTYMVTPSFYTPNASATPVNYLTLPTATKPTDASLDFRVDCVRPNDATYARRPFQWGIYFHFSASGAFDASIFSSISTFPTVTVPKATLDAVAAQGSRIQMRVAWDATTDTLTVYARSTSTLLALTDNTGWTQVGQTTFAGIQANTSTQVPYIGFGDSNQCFNGNIYGVTGYVNGTLTYNVLPSDVGNIDTVTSFTASSGQTVTVVRGGSPQTQLIIQKKPIPTWSGSQTTYRHAMYWIANKTGVLDFVDVDLSGRYNINADDQITVTNGDWIIATNPNFSASAPAVDLTLSQLTFQVLPLSTETFVQEKIAIHSRDKNDPHADAGYLFRTSGTTYTPVSIATTFRNASAVATIVTATPHGFRVNTNGVITGLNNSFDGNFTVQTVPTTTSFTYASTGASSASTVVTGGFAAEYDTRRDVDSIFSKLGHNHATDIAVAITAHTAASDPHPIYLTQAEGDVAYANANHAHPTLYEVFGAVAQHLANYDHASFLKQSVADARYFPITGTFDTRYYTKTEVDTKFLSVEDEVTTTDGSDSSRIFIGASTPASASVKKGDLWIQTPSLTATVPITPTSFAGTATSSSAITLTWTTWQSSVGVTAVTLLRSTDPAFGTSTSLTVTPLTSQTYADSGLIENTVYYYRLSATNAVGAGAYQQISVTTANATPPVVTGVGASAVASTANISVSWTAPAGSFPDPAANRYEVFASGTSVGTTNTTSFTITGLTESTSYTVGVRTVDSAGLTSSIVNAASAVTTNNVAPPAPTGQANSGITSSQMTLSWNSVTGISDFKNYEVFKNAVSQGTTTNTSYTFTGLTASTSYTMGVRTVDTGNLTSSTVTATSSTTASSDTTPPSDATISSFKPETSYGRMVLRGTWPSDADFTSATIQRSTDGTTWTNDGTYTVGVGGTTVGGSINGATGHVVNSGTAYTAGTTVYVRVIVSDNATPTANSRTGAAQTYTLITSPSVIAADSTNSWRNTNGGQYNSQTNFRPYQGYFSNAAWNAIGLWYYGTNPYSQLYNSGRRTVTSTRFLLIRWDAGSLTAMTPILALHQETTNPGTVTGVSQPTLFQTGTSSGVSITSNATTPNIAWATLPTTPVNWGQEIVNGTYRGVAVYAPTAPVYANFASTVDNSLTGAIEFTHLG